MRGLRLGRSCTRIPGEMRSSLPSDSGDYRCAPATRSRTVEVIGRAAHVDARDGSGGVRHRAQCSCRVAVCVHAGGHRIAATPPRVVPGRAAERHRQRRGHRSVAVSRTSEAGRWRSSMVDVSTAWPAGASGCGQGSSSPLRDSLRGARLRPRPPVTPSSASTPTRLGRSGASPPTAREPSSPIRPVRRPPPSLRTTCT